MNEQISLVGMMIVLIITDVLVVLQIAKFT